VRPSSLAVIGLGAIGGSLAWQARRAGVPRVIGYSPAPAESVQALKASAVTEIADSPERATEGADLTVLAAPPGATITLLKRVAPALDPKAILTDVCSIKRPIMSAAAAAGLGDRFAGGHPLAGTHDTGFTAARPDRLRGCVVYVCEAESPEGHRAARAVMGFWETVLEASPVLIEPEAHDRQLAWTSHLPQAVAYALAHALGERNLGGVSYGTGARDTTRLAASSPELWLDILLYNQPEIEGALTRTEQSLAELRRLLAARDEPGLREFLRQAQDFRQGLDR
jgi:prephenate dehydrogenase